jgi:hypothetical protein
MRGYCCSPCSLLQDVRHRFYKLYLLLGFQFICITVLVEHILQAFIAGGGSGGLIGAPIILLLSVHGLPATRLQVLETIAVSSWQLKPLLGILSDCLYIGGYNKIPYIVIVSVIGVASSSLIVALYPVSPLFFTLLLFFVFLQIATSDLLLEARYVQKTTTDTSARTSLYSFIQFGSCFCQLASISVVGLFIHYHVPLEWLYLSPILPFTLMIILMLRNWIGEEVYQGDSRLTSLLCGYCWFKEHEYQSKTVQHIFREIPMIGFDQHKMYKNWRIFVLALIIGTLSISISILGLFDVSTTYLFVLSIMGSLLMIAAFFCFLDRRIAKVQTFVVITNMFSISLRGGTFFFYTDPPSAYPEGPHFSREFYISVMSGVGILLALVGVVTYTSFMYRWSYHKVFFFTGLIYVIACLPNLVFFKRWNLWLGIPDIVFILGAEVIQVIVGQWNSMPFGIMMLGLCPEGVEASLYAILAGSNNIGLAFASYQGAFVLEQLHIKPSGNLSGESAQFDNLWIASLISTLLQLVPLAFIKILIPNAKQTDDLLEPMNNNNNPPFQLEDFSLSEVELSSLESDAEEELQEYQRSSLAS